MTKRHRKNRRPPENSDDGRATFSIDLFTYGGTKVGTIPVPAGGTWDIKAFVPVNAVGSDDRIEVWANDTHLNEPFGYIQNAKLYRNTGEEVVDAPSESSS